MPFTRSSSLLSHLSLRVIGLFRVIFVDFEYLLSKQKGNGFNVSFSILSVYVFYSQGGSYITFFLTGGSNGKEVMTV